MSSVNDGIKAAEERRRVVGTTLLIVLFVGLAGFGVYLNTATPSSKAGQGAGNAGRSLPPEHGHLAVGTSGRDGATAHSAFYREVLAAYEQRDAVKAAEVLGKRWGELVGEAEGCELSISVYAGARDFSQLAEVAKACMAVGHGTGIAQEGFAYSMANQGKVEEAIAILSKEAEAHRDVARVQVALANLYVMMGRDQEAAGLFHKVIAGADSWSLWLGQALKVAALRKDKRFVQDVVDAVLKKTEAVPSREHELLTVAQELGLQTEAERLAARLATHMKEAQELPPPHPEAVGT